MDPKARSLDIVLVISAWMWFLAKKKTLMKDPEFVAAPTNSPLFALSVFLEKKYSEESSVCPQSAGFKGLETHQPHQQ